MCCRQIRGAKKKFDIKKKLHEFRYFQFTMTACTGYRQPLTLQEWICVLRVWNCHISFSWPLRFFYTNEIYFQDLVKDGRHRWRHKLKPVVFPEARFSQIQNDDRRLVSIAMYSECILALTVRNAGINEVKSRSIDRHFSCDCNVAIRKLRMKLTIVWIDWNFASSALNFTCENC